MRTRFLCAAVVLILLLCPSFSSADEHEKKFFAFWESIKNVADKVSWSGEYNMQDVEFVRNEMLGDETVYSRAWYSDYYVLIRNYRNKDWSSSYVANFWTNSEELIFADGIKVGSPFSKVESYFGKNHLSYDDLGRYRVFQIEEETDGGGVLMFSAENGKVTSIGCYILDENQTSKMNFLFNLYSSLYVGEIAGEKVNVREYSPDGKVRFQVSRSKGDRLLIDINRNDGWYSVVGRIINGTLKTVPYYSVSGQFVNVRKITPSERRLFISQYRK